MSYVARAIERVERTPRRFVSDWESWYDEIPRHKVYFGGHMCDWDDCCHRTVCHTSLYPYPQISIVEPYLRSILKDQQSQQFISHRWLLKQRPPMFFDGHIIEEDRLIYVDLDAAYWSIYSRATLDIFFDGTRLQNGNVHFLDAEDLRPLKLARNGLVGMTRRLRRHGSDFGTYFIEDLPESVQWPDFWGFIMAALESVAWVARELGAVYVHTDGFVFTHPDSVEEFTYRIDRDYRLSASVRADGPGYLLGMGRWKIGDHTAGPQHLIMRSDSGNLLGVPRSVDSMSYQEEHLTRTLQEFLRYA